MVLVVAWGGQYGPGASGDPWGWVSWGGSALGLRSWPGWVLVTLGCCFSGGGMRRCWDACAGGRRLPAWRPHCSGLVRGGVWGSGGALPPGWGYGWAWGAWVLVGVPPGAWVGACAWPGSGVGVFDASVPPQGGGGSNRGGVNGLYLGVLLSYVVWELTG